MTTEELFKTITDEPKWYGGKITRQLASSILKRHKLGKYNNYEWLFEKFGYKVERIEKWTKNS